MHEIVRATQGALVAGDLGVPVTGVSIDSRTLRLGEAFFAIRGHNLDGHAFVTDAANRGAACLVVRTLTDDTPVGVPLVLVEDTTRALGALAAMHRQRFDVPVIGVTGSNGKTTTKELIAGALGVRWQTLKSLGSFNNQWGLPLTLLRLGPEHQAVVVEIGTNRPGEIRTLADIAGPTIGVVTTVAPAHTEFFGSLEAVREEKADLIRALTPAGRAVLNADDARVATMAPETRAAVITFGIHSSARVRCVGPVVDDEREMSFMLATGDERQRIRLSLSGRHNVTNALAAAAVGVTLGMTLTEIAAGLATVRPAPGRGVWRRAGTIRILDDTYNANPASVRAAMETIAAHRGDHRVIVVLGDMLELGAISEASHREVGREIVAFGADELVGMGPYARMAVEAAREAGLAEAHATRTLEDTVAHLLKRLAEGDIVLVKGSRGMRMERVVDALVARLARADSGS